MGLFTLPFQVKVFYGEKNGQEFKLELDRETTEEHCLMASSQGLAFLPFLYSTRPLSWGGMHLPASVKCQHRSPQTCPQVKLVYAIPQLRFPS